MASNGSGFLPTSKNKRQFFLRALLWTVAIHGLILLFFVVRISWDQKSKASAPMMVELWEALPQPVVKPTPVKPMPDMAPKPPSLPPKADIALKKKEEKPKPEEKKEPIPPKKEEPAKKTTVAKKEEMVKKPKEIKQAEPQKTTEKTLKKEAVKPVRKEPVKVAKQEPPKKVPPKKEVPPKVPPKPTLPKEEKPKETAKAADLAKPLDNTVPGRANAPSSSTLSGNSAGSSLQGELLNGYIQKIQAKIYRYMNTAVCGPSSWEVIASVRLMPGGTLLSAPEISKSSGMAACDRAIMAAIMQAEPLPVPEDPVLFSQFRHLNLKFRPQ